MQNQEAIEVLDLLRGVLSRFTGAYPAVRSRLMGVPRSLTRSEQLSHIALEDKALALLHDVWLFVDHAKSYGPRLVRDDNLSVLVLVSRLVYVLNGYLAFFPAPKDLRKFHGEARERAREKFLLEGRGRGVVKYGVKFVNSMKTRFSYE